MLVLDLVRHVPACLRFTLVLIVWVWILYLLCFSCVLLIVILLFVAIDCCLAKCAGIIRFACSAYLVLYL